MHPWINHGNVFMFGEVPQRGFDVRQMSAQATAHTVHNNTRGWQAGSAQQTHLTSPGTTAKSNNQYNMYANMQGSYQKEMYNNNINSPTVCTGRIYYPPSAYNTDPRQSAMMTNTDPRQRESATNNGQHYSTMMSNTGRHQPANMMNTADPRQSAVLTNTGNQRQPTILTNTHQQHQSTMMANSNRCQSTMLTNTHQHQSAMLTNSGRCHSSVMPSQMTHRRQQTANLDPDNYWAHPDSRRSSITISPNATVCPPSTPQVSPRMSQVSPSMSQVLPGLSRVSPSMSHVSHSMSHVSSSMPHVSQSMPHVSQSMSHVSPNVYSPNTPGHQYPSNENHVHSGNSVPRQRIPDYNNLELQLLKLTEAEKNIKKLYAKNLKLTDTMIDMYQQLSHMQHMNAQHSAPLPRPGSSNQLSVEYHPPSTAASTGLKLPVVVSNDHGTTHTPTAKREPLGDSCMLQGVVSQTPPGVTTPTQTNSDDECEILTVSIPKQLSREARPIKREPISPPVRSSQITIKQEKTSNNCTNHEISHAGHPTDYDHTEHTAEQSDQSSVLVNISTSDYDTSHIAEQSNEPSVLGNKLTHSINDTVLGLPVFPSTAIQLSSLTHSNNLQSPLPHPSDLQSVPSTELHIKRDDDDVYMARSSSIEQTKSSDPPKYICIDIDEENGEPIIRVNGLQIVSDMSGLPIASDINGLPIVSVIGDTRLDEQQTNQADLLDTIAVQDSTDYPDSDSEVNIVSVRISEHGISPVYVKKEKQNSDSTIVHQASLINQSVTTQSASPESLINQSSYTDSLMNQSASSITNSLMNQSSNTDSLVNQSEVSDTDQVLNHQSVFSDNNPVMKQTVPITNELIKKDKPRSSCLYTTSDIQCENRSTPAIVDKTAVNNQSVPITNGLIKKDNPKSSCLFAGSDIQSRFTADVDKASVNKTDTLPSTPAVKRTVDNIKLEKVTSNKQSTEKKSAGSASIDKNVAHNTDSQSMAVLTKTAEVTLNTGTAANTGVLTTAPSPAVYTTTAVYSATASRDVHTSPASKAVFTNALSKAMQTPVASKAIDTTVANTVALSTGSSKAMLKTAAPPAVHKTSVSPAVHTSVVCPAIHNNVITSAVHTTIASPTVQTTSASSAVDKAASKAVHTTTTTSRTVDNTAAVHTTVASRSIHNTVANPSVHTTATCTPPQNNVTTSAVHSQVVHKAGSPSVTLKTIETEANNSVTINETEKDLLHEPDKNETQFDALLPDDLYINVPTPAVYRTAMINYTNTQLCDEDEDEDDDTVLHIEESPVNSPDSSPGSPPMMIDDKTSRDSSPISPSRMIDAKTSSNSLSSYNTFPVRSNVGKVTSVIHNQSQPIHTYYGQSHTKSKPTRTVSEDFSKLPKKHNPKRLHASTSLDLDIKKKDYDSKKRRSSLDEKLSSVKKSLASRNTIKKTVKSKRSSHNLPDEQLFIPTPKKLTFQKDKLSPKLESLATKTMSPIRRNSTEIKPDEKSKNSVQQKVTPIKRKSSVSCSDESYVAIKRSSVSSDESSVKMKKNPSSKSPNNSKLQSSTNTKWHDVISVDAKKQSALQIFKIPKMIPREEIKKIGNENDHSRSSLSPSYQSQLPVSLNNHHMRHIADYNNPSVPDKGIPPKELAYIGKERHGFICVFRVDNSPTSINSRNGLIPLQHAHKLLRSYYPSYNKLKEAMEKYNMNIRKMTHTEQKYFQKYSSTNPGTSLISASSLDRLWRMNTADKIIYKA